MIEQDAPPSQNRSAQLKLLAIVAKEILLFALVFVLAELLGRVFMAGLTWMVANLNHFVLLLIAISAGDALFMLKKNFQSAYGQLERYVGIIAITLAIQNLAGGGVRMATVLPLIAGIYVLVRGNENSSIARMKKADTEGLFQKLGVPATTTSTSPVTTPSP